MENIDRLEVFKYLNSLSVYFEGDLDTFEKVATDFEAIERPSLQDFNMGSMFDPEKFDNFNQNLDVEGNEQFFRLTVPLALSLFSVIDLVGYLISLHNMPRDTEKNFKSFFEKSASEVTEKEVEIINRIFRQGLAHAYFPKLGLGVKYHSTNPTNKLFFKSSHGTIFLNVNRLKQIVIDAFRKIIEDANLYPNMELKYQELVALYRQQIGENIEDLSL